jgi:CMP-N-acetylneuraminic acid synthetase
MNERPFYYVRVGTSPLLLSFSFTQVEDFISHLRMTTPLRRELAEMTLASSSSEEQQESVSSSYPQRDPPQSSLTRSPERVIPYRSHEQLKEEEL